MAASVLLLVVGGASGWSLRGTAVERSETSGITALAQEAAYTFNVYGVDGSHPVEFGPTDKAQLVSWISSRTGRTVSVPDLTASGYAFMGGRLVATPHGAAGLLMYSNGQGQRLAMLVRPMAIDRDTRMSEHSYGDINGVTWASKGTGFSLVGPAPADLLHPIADEYGSRWKARLARRMFRVKVCRGQIKLVIGRELFRHFRGRGAVARPQAGVDHQRCIRAHDDADVGETHDGPNVIGHSHCVFT